MLESGFSKQVVQPYLNKEFPLFKEAHEDRLFKHITFSENVNDLKVRLSAVDHNYKRPSSSTVTQKVVPTNLVINDPKTDIFRVKMVLSQEDHGNSESYWVTQKSMDSTFASTHNQYRMRGVTAKNWKSDWVYSELRDFDNDLIVYNMLYDILDLMLTVHDDQIDYLMDYIVSDTFAQVIQEMSPEFATNMDPEEFKGMGIQELLSMFSNRVNNNPKEEIVSKLGEQFLVLADEMKKGFKESITSSPEEFAQLYRIYKLIDQYQERKVDFLQLLVEIFLEDHYEKLVKNADIEVLLQNDEEMGIYLNGRYEFDIKNELITAICDASPDDHFVTCLNDAVQLISEPVFFERLVASQDEELATFLRMVIKDLYVPMLAIDRHLVELHSDLDDEHHHEKVDSVVEFTILQDEHVIRNMIVADSIEAVIKGDLEPIDDYHMDVIDHILQFMNDSRKSTFIDYNFGEVIQVLLGVGENFRQSYTKEFGNLRETTVLRLVDRYDTTHTVSSQTLKESYYATLKDAHHIMPTVSPNQIKESYTASLVDSIVNKYSIFKKIVQEVIASEITDKLQSHATVSRKDFSESLKASQMDVASIKDMLGYFLTEETKQLSMVDTARSRSMVDDMDWHDKLEASQQDAYYNLFKHYLRNPNKFPLIDRKFVELHHDLRDFFLLDGTDSVHYALGDMDEGWPLGVFRLGINTLKGGV